MSIMDRTLLKEEKEELLYELFTFCYDGDVLLNDNGAEFYGYSENDRWHFNTLDNILTYYALKQQERGANNAKFEIRKILGL